MSTPDPARFSQAWLAAFNEHDLGAVLDHFHDDVVFTSPVAARALPDSKGVVRGKKALLAYWTLALERVPNLRFELLGVYAGVDTLVLNYRNQAGGLVNEVLTFDGGLVRQGHGTYLGSSAQAGGTPTPPTPTS
jgi:ketosteroid isomerase-like protein